MMSCYLSVVVLGILLMINAHFSQVGKKKCQEQIQKQTVKAIGTTNLWIDLNHKCSRREKENAWQMLVHIANSAYTLWYQLHNGI